MADVCHRRTRVTILTDASVLQPSIFLSPSGGFRISIPSTRAAARIPNNPLATDSLQIYADQMGFSFPQINSGTRYETLRHQERAACYNHTLNHQTIKPNPFHPCSQNIPLSSSNLDKIFIGASMSQSEIQESHSHRDSWIKEMERQKVRSEHPVIRLKFQGHELLESNEKEVNRTTVNNLTLTNGHHGEELKSNSSTLTVLPRKIYLNRTSFPNMEHCTEELESSSSDSLTAGLSQLHISPSMSMMSSTLSGFPSTDSSDSSIILSNSVKKKKKKKIVVTSTLSSDTTSDSLCHCSDPFWTWNMHHMQSMTPCLHQHQHSHENSYATSSSVFRDEDCSLPPSDVPCIHTYQFTTLDQEQLTWLHIQVKEVREQEMRTCSTSTFDGLTLLEEDEEIHVSCFQRHMPEFAIEKDENEGTICGTLRIYINLIKPIKISLRKAGISLSEMNDMSLSQSVILELLDNLAMFLPRGTCKQVQLHMETTVREAIGALLEHLYIKDSCHRFALYEHSLENEHTILVTKLSNDVSLLRHILTWAHEDGNVMRESVSKRRLVLQENESSDIKWTDFTLPELYNFIRILDKEKTQYEHGLKLHYGLRRQYLLELLEQRQSMKKHSINRSPKW